MDKAVDKVLPFAKFWNSKLTLSNPSLLALGLMTKDVKSNRQVLIMQNAPAKFKDEYILK
jgi:hypothetical protein